ncbi:hypothetical protein [Xylanimonas ulmi]|uniref:Colicin import membrane protein n=1 Tax=Xylanimonas ulmi TaxID=228973 RepID=A0A4Q7M5G3_9MICO|nr:hypothetical protein [Xylanibacterium ulmi]RZS62217.1 hypothetical protein EV386_2538 [Xylanibacterium ulmi]
MTESDGMNEALEGQLRIAITVAGQIGEYIARARESALRRAQAAGEHNAQELATRLHAERAAARAELTAIAQDGWWEHAATEQVVHAWQVARAWADEDPSTRMAAERVRAEIWSRYGIDVDSTGANPADVRAALEQAEADRQNAEAERGRAAAEETEAALLMRQADAEERRAHEAGPDFEQALAAASGTRNDAHLVYDSAERRQRLARDLEAKGVAPDVVDTHVRADISQATLSEAAVPSTKAVKAKRSHRRGPLAARPPELTR